MTTKELIRELNRTEDAGKIRKFVDAARTGLRKQGRVTFTYTSLQELFQRCDPTIDAERFEELMLLADSA